MPRRKRTTAEIAGAREAQAIAATLGRDARSTRLRRRLTQRELGRRVGLGQSEISHLELGHGENTSIATWTAIGIALNRPLAIGFGRDVADPGPRDAGHLVAQEFVLRLGAATGRAGSFELPTRPANPALSIDVCLRDRRHGLLLVIEIWNRLDDLGAATRTTLRKIAEANDLAALHEPPDRVAACWLLVDTAANRELVSCYPAVIRAIFDGSSQAWVRALTTGTVPPDRPGVAWIDPRRGRLTELRLPQHITRGGDPAGPR
jgi:transcriptional regulator with XRE-family HTH domain